MKLSVADLFFCIYQTPISIIRWYMFLLPLCWLAIWILISISGCVFQSYYHVQMLSFICMLVSVLFFGIIFYMTIIVRDSNKHEIILIPFYSLYEARRQPELYRQMLMNIFLFEPFGLTLPFGLEWVKMRIMHHKQNQNSDNKPKQEADFSKSRCQIARYSFIFSLTFSFLIEICQGLFSRGRVEIDDILMNSLGALIGILTYLICGFIKP